MELSRPPSPQKDLLFNNIYSEHESFPGGTCVKGTAANAGATRDTGSIPGWEDPWRRARQPTSVFFPGESHRQRSLVGYSPQHHKESDMTEVT